MVAPYHLSTHFLRRLMTLLPRSRWVWEDGLGPHGRHSTPPALPDHIAMVAASWQEFQLRCRNPAQTPACRQDVFGALPATWRPHTSRVHLHRS